MGHGDGDGHLLGCSVAQTEAVGCETALFWSDLSFAQLIRGSFTAATDALVPDTVTPTTFDTYMARAKWGNGRIFVYFDSATAVNHQPFIGQNQIEIFTISQGTLGSDGINSGFMIGSFASYTGSLTPGEALNVDQKVDDGHPCSGDVQVNSDEQTVNDMGCGGPATVRGCIDNTVPASPKYPSTGTNKVCGLIFGAGF